MKNVMKIDNKLVKKHYPRQNNDDNLTFNFEADPNLCLVKNKIAIHFTIELDQNYLPDNGFAAKQFSMCSVEVNSQRVSSNKARLILFYNYLVIVIVNNSEESTFLMTTLQKLAIMKLVIWDQFTVLRVIMTLSSTKMKMMQIKTN